MNIIKCKCGHYKMLDDELCPVCHADYSTGSEYEVLDDQDLAHARWSKLGGENGFNQYMKSIEAPMFMICPECRFKMLTTETHCPKCGLAVKYKKSNNKAPFINRLAVGFSWFQLIYLGIPIIVSVLLIIYATIKVIL